ncbi:hypothetical protein [Actinomadura macrotermitis]|uniref:hypothetical protein n=1 Tax=Actinomadura macrotermitis TaxID=2585200 RepID=UPI001A9AF183|nr:hypothetical protein [Actinomadura macrotermitis]
MPRQPAPQEPARIAPRLVEVTDHVLFGDIWQRPEPSPRDRGLITRPVPQRAARRRAGQQAERPGAVRGDHQPGALYAGRPNAMPAITQLKRIAGERDA